MAEHRGSSTTRNSGPFDRNAWQRAWQREAARKNPGYKHGLTADEYWTLQATQDGLCAICRMAGTLCVDHDHACCPGKWSCGKCVRGLVCRFCNLILARDADLLRRAAAYLDVPPARIANGTPNRVPG